MVMTSSAIEGESHECFAGVFDRVVDPGIAVEHIPIADQIPRSANGRGVVRSNFVRRQHLHDHTIIRLVIIERLDNPVSPSPDMGLALTNLRTIAIPVAVAPDIHPVAPPAFAVMRAGKQFIDDFFPGIGRTVIQKRLQLFGCWWQADQIQIDSPQLHMFGSVWQSIQMLLIMSLCNERINRIDFGRLCW